MDNSLWKARYNFSIFIFTILLFWTASLIFRDHIIHMGYIVAAVTLTIIFFSALRNFDNKWSLLPEKIFITRILLWSFAFRLVSAVGLYVFYQYWTGIPFEFYAVDSLIYHEKGMWIAEHFTNMNFDLNRLTSDLEFSDKGYNIYLGIVYSIFGDQLIVPRIINVVLSTLTVLMIYRIAYATIGPRPARLAAVMAMLLPNFLLYLGTHLKEPLMLCVTVLAFYQGIRVVKYGKRQIINLVILILLIFLLFTFRTVLAAAVFGSIMAYALLVNSSSRRRLNAFAVGFMVLLFIILATNSNVGNEIAAFYEKRTNALSDNMQFRAAREGGNRFALMASAPLFISIVLMAPFPSFVYVLRQDNLWMFLGANFIKNLYAFFAIVGIIYGIKHSFRQQSLLIVFVLGYLGILANSGFAISERFHLPVLPLMIILAAAGAEKLKSMRTNYFNLYLALIFVLVTLWNYIKIAGRI